MAELSRRALIKATGAVGAAILPATLPLDIAKAEDHDAAAQAAAPSAGAVHPPQAPPTTYVFFNTEEAAFIESAVARLIPAGQDTPAALEAAGPTYID